MSRPKTIDRSQVPVMAKEEVHRAQMSFDQHLSHLVLALLKADHTTKAAFARKIGYAQGNLNSVLSDSEVWADKHWSVPLLICTAKALNTTVGDLIQAAESYAKAAEGSLPRLFYACRGTAPRSQARLQKLVWESEGYRPGATTSRERELLELAYGVAQFEQGCPSFCRAYYAGELSDEDALRLLDSARANENQAKNLAPDRPPAPLWAAVRDIWLEDVKK